MTPPPGGRPCSRAVLVAMAVLLAVPPAAAADPRIRDVPYDADAVVEITGHVGYATTVFFHPGEVVESVAIGDDAWHVAPEANRISLKPRGDAPLSSAAAFESDTNMTVWTSRRVYFFALRTGRTRDPGQMTYAVRFAYPPDPAEAAAATAARWRESGRRRLATGADAAIAGAGPASAPPGAGVGAGGVRHFDYSWSGSPALRPLAAFDDGRFTYLRFADGRPLPAIYAGEADGSESIANLHIRGRWVILHRVASRLVLRDGALVGCVLREGAG